MSSIQTPENEFTREIVGRLASLRFRWLTVNLVTGLLAVGFMLGSLWFLVAAIDYNCELSLGVRQILALIGGIVASVGTLVFATLIARSGRLKDLIRRLEGRFADFGQRLRTVLDIHEGRFTAPAPMQRVLGNQTLARWETSSPDKLIAYRKLWQWFAMATVVFGFLLASIGVGNQWSTALQRSLGANIPYTVFAVEPGNMEVLEGTDVSLTLNLEGRLGRKVAAKWRKIEGDGNAVANHGKNVDTNTELAESWIENELDPVETIDATRIAKYSLALGKLKQSVEYRFETSIGNSETYRIQVRPLVQVAEIKTTVVPPTYTKASTRVFSENEVTALSGSDVMVRWVTTQPLSELAIMIDDRESPESLMKANGTDDPCVWELKLPSRRTLNWRTQGAGLDGTPLEVAKGRLRIREDAPPHIAWKRGDESMEVHTLAEVPLQISVSDDFAVASAQIILQFADGDERVLTELDPEQVSDMSRIDLMSILELETLGMTQRDYIGFYAVATDYCEPNPRTVSTDVRFIDIRPLRQKFREEEMTPGDPNGRSFASLEDLMKSQRLLINQTRRLIKLPTEALVDQIKNIDRMVEAQSELAGNTAFLAEFFISRGNDDVESLRQAEASMLQAADSLAAGTFATALLQEQDALRWLVETRNELERILIKNPKQAKQIAQAMQALKMKLRRTRPPTALDIAIQLEQIASEQEQIVKQAPLVNKQDEDALEKLLDKQTDLAQTVQDLSAQVTKQTWPSKKIPERMDELVKSIVSADKMLKDQNTEEFVSQADAVSDQARELAAHIRALNPEEPLESLSSLAALSQQAARMETELAQSLQNPNGQTSSTPSTQNMGSNGDRGRLTNRIAAKAETIEDVLASLRAAGNKEASEAAEQLESWLEHAEFPRTLAESKEAPLRHGAEEETDAAANTNGKRKEASNDQSDRSHEDATARSVEYAAAAEFMSDLYRQLASPRLEKLRKLEAKAREIQEALAESKGETGASTAETESNALIRSEAKVEVRELQEQLQSAGLGELVELLEKAKSSENGIANYRGHGPLPAALLGVVRALRLEIQAIIMEQISADRNIPVPQNYVEAVDRYFESISSPIEESELLR